MNVELMRAKIHRATVTSADLHYEGSISIDRDFIDAAGFFINEKVDVLNIDTGARLTTYVIEAERGTRMIGLNGAAARLAHPGDKVIILSYCSLPIEDAPGHKPTVVLMDEDNAIKGVL
ncbi:MAG: aspartate 1-decarboxylase [Hyphomicrobiaceae bacterium]|nr:aspartate 1-decarboxylase [Hyphomicrobiaceae bacterium]